MPFSKYLVTISIIGLLLMATPLFADSNTASIQPYQQFERKALSRPPVEIIQPEASCDFLIRSSDGRYIEMASAY